MLKKDLANLRSVEYFKEYSKYITHLLANLNFHLVDEVAKLLIKTSKQGGTIYFAGNGGSASAASHFATDFSHGLVGGTGQLVKAVSLSDNASLLTAISNDHGYENIFINQLKNLLQINDVLVVISASGNSPNVVKAAEFAKEKGVKTVALVGFDGGQLKEICDYVVQVETDKGQYGPVEDMHTILNHMLATYLILTLNKYEKN